jgi:hypothetical protein
MKLRAEEVDLADLAEGLRDAVTENPPLGYLEGRTVLRDLVEDRLGCSDLEAEELVDTLVSCGFLRFSGDPAARSQAGVWHVQQAIA